jgi:FtsH-binding integral membrane protein
MNPSEFQATNQYGMHGMTVADATVDVRRTFIRKTYTHLAAAVYAFVGLSYLFHSIGLGQRMLMLMGQSQYSWLIVLGGFIAVSWVAERWAQSSASIGMQYAGLFLYVLAESIIFAPLLAIAATQTITLGGVGTLNIITAAAWTTLGMFGLMTAIAFLTRADFSFLRTFLGIVMISAFGLIIASIFMDFALGIWFAWLMVVAACGYILYHTSNVIHHYRTGQYVAAALALFASVALLFWYLIQIFMSNRD